MLKPLSLGLGLLFLLSSPGDALPFSFSNKTRGDLERACVKDFERRIASGTITPTAQVNPNQIQQICSCIFGFIQTASDNSLKDEWYQQLAKVITQGVTDPRDSWLVSQLPRTSNWEKMMLVSVAQSYLMLIERPEVKQCFKPALQSEPEKR
uniref:Uncharacterized protein n=1 Tax=Cyanothece sp. (strain PCC 7425 / ATCC 29141) TaxID=395961 RepID=B8HS84_CYAP4